MLLDLNPFSYTTDAKEHQAETSDLDRSTLSDLISSMEIAAYSLVRSGRSSAAQIVFLAVADLEKIKKEVA